MASLTRGTLIGIGNALLDVTAEVEPSLLQKYGIEADTAIRADERHESLLLDLENHYSTTHCAGGAGLNVLRAAQWVLQTSGICTFMGCIGNDSAGRMLLESAEKAGVDAACQIANCPTSMCIVMISDDQRSLCSFQRASGFFNIEKLFQPEMQNRLRQAMVIYVSGFFLNVCTKTVRYIATFASENQKRFVLDLGAPRIVGAHRDLLQWLLPKTDVVFGNEAEFQALACTLNLVDGQNGENICQVVQQLVPDRVERSTQDRTVIMTRGKQPAVVATSTGITQYPCLAVAENSIVDVNGAGDAFLGGFLAKYIQRCSVEECIASGLLTANVVIQQRGCNFPKNFSTVTQETVYTGQ